MSQIIHVEALPRAGISYTFTESYRKDDKGAVGLDVSRGRGWPCGQRLTVEVLDQDEDGPLVEMEVLDRSRNQNVKRQLPDMERIGRKTFEALKQNSFIRILADAGTTNEEASRAVEVARKQAIEAAQKALDLELKNAALESELKAVKAERDSLRASLDQALAPPAPKGDDRSGKKGKSV